MINGFSEKACDNYFIKKNCGDEVVVDYKLLKKQIDTLNSIIKEIIDMAIIVARFLETRKKLEKKSKGYNLAKSKNVSFKLVASAPTTEEFVDLLKKIRLAINMMVRLNPFVTNPNIPELLHYIIAPFSLITSVCGHQLVRSVKKPNLSVKAIWLIEHCFTTNELGFWRTLGEAWNKADKVHDIEDIVDHDLKKKFNNINESSLEETKSIRNYKTTDSGVFDFDQNLAVVIQHHFDTKETNSVLIPGSYVNITDEIDDFYLVNDQNGCNVWVPKCKLSSFGKYHHYNVFNRIIRNLITEYYLQDTSSECVRYHFYASEDENRQTQEYVLRSESENVLTKEETESQQTVSQQSLSQQNTSQHTTETVNTDSKSISEGSRTLTTKSTTSIHSETAEKSKSHTSQLSGSSEKSKSTKSEKSSKSTKTTDSSKTKTELKCENTNPTTKTEEIKKYCEKRRKRFCGWCCVRRSNVSIDSRFDTREIDTCALTNLEKSPSTASITTEKQETEVYEVYEQEVSDDQQISDEQQILEEKQCYEQKNILEDQTEEITEELASEAVEKVIEEVKNRYQSPIIVKAPKIADSEIKCPQFEQKSALNKEVSLSWKKDDASECDLIRIEGIKLFKIKIRMTDDQECAKDTTMGICKANLLLKDHPDITLKPNSKIMLHQDDKTKDISYAEKSICSKEFVTPSFTDCRGGLEAELLGSRVTTKQEPEKIQYIKRTKSPSPKLEETKDSNKSAKSLQTSKDESKTLPQQKSEQNIKKIAFKDIETNNIESDVDPNSSNAEIFKIIRKYISNANLSSPTQNRNEIELLEKRPKDSIDEFYENHVCKDCGGVYESENTDHYEEKISLSKLDKSNEKIEPEKKSDGKSSPGSNKTVNDKINAYFVSLDSKLGSVDSDELKKIMEWSSKSSPLDTTFIG